VSTFVAPLQCVEHPNGLRTMSSFPSVACWDPESGHREMMIAAGCAVCVPLTFLSSALYAVINLPAKVVARDMFFQKSWGFLFRTFQPSTHWYAGVLLASKLLLGLARVLPNPVLQGSWCFVTLFGTLTTVAHFCPWCMYNLNVLDMICAWGLLLVLLSISSALEPADLKIISVVCAIIISVLLVVLLGTLGDSIRKNLWRSMSREVRSLKKLAAEAVSKGEEAEFHELHKGGRWFGVSLKTISNILENEARRQSEAGGISVAYLISEEFLALGMDRTGLDNPSFYDLKGPFFQGQKGKDALGRTTRCPRDGERGCALIDFLPRKHRGKCTHFLSWTWGYSIKMVQDGLKLWLKHSELVAEETFLYCCFFVNNQYRILVDGDGSNSDNLEEIFELRLTTIGAMVALLDTWDKPRYLTRVWTIFEQYTATKRGIPVTMILPTDSCRSLIRQLEKGSDGMSKVSQALVGVDSENSKAFSAKDEIKVKGLIERDIGFVGVNVAVEKSLIAWIGTCVQDHFRHISDFEHCDIGNSRSLRNSNSSSGAEIIATPWKKRMSMLAMVIAQDELELVADVEEEQEEEDNFSIREQEQEHMTGQVPHLSARGANEDTLESVEICKSPLL